MNADTFSLVKFLLIASWYLGFLAADVAPAAGQGSSTAGATGLFLLRLRDYFQTSGSDTGKVILALRTIERWVGQDAEVLRHAYLSNSLPPTQRDFTGYNVSYEVLNVSDSTPASTFTNGQPGSGGLANPPQRSQLSDTFHSIDISYQVFWTIYSSYREEAQNFNATIVQHNFVKAIRESKNLEIWENWYLRTDIYPQAAPIIAQLPLGYAQGFTIAIQLMGTMLLPFVVEMETLLLSALFSPLNERLCIPQLNVIQVNQTVGSVQTVDVTMSGVFNSSSSIVAQVFTDVLCNLSCSGSSANAFAQSFLQQNVTLSSARLLSITPDGSSLQAQAAAMGFPSVNQPLQAGAATGSSPNNLLGKTVGSIVAFCCFVGLLIGAMHLVQQKRRRLAEARQDCLVSRDSLRRSQGSDVTHGSSGTEGSKRSPGSLGSSFKDLQKWSLFTVRAEDIEVCKHPDGTPFELGRGGFCRVLKGVHGGIREVALKMLLDVEDPQSELERFTKELELLKMLNFDSRIVQLYGACILEGCPVLVLEFMGGGDLSEAMSNDKRGRLRWYNRGQYIALDVVRGLAYLHACKCLHGDLTCRNILLNEDHTVAKVGDLGLSKMLQSTISELPMGGTLAFAAPEVLLNMRCNEKADIFSFAVVLWTICTQEVPIRGHLRTLRVPEECPLAIAQLIDDCLENPPRDRPSARQAYEIIKAALVPATSSPPSSQEERPSAPKAYDNLTAALMPAPSSSPPTQEGLDNAELRAAAEHCRKLLSTSDMQRSLSAAKKGTPQAPKSSGQLGRRWQSVAGYALSSLAPHDVHAKSSHRRVMPRDLSSCRAAPNPFDLDNDSSMPGPPVSTGSQHLASTSANSNPPARSRPSHVINAGATETSFQHSTSAETRAHPNPFKANPYMANPLHQDNSSTKSAQVSTISSSHSASKIRAGSKEHSAECARTGGTTVPLSTLVSSVACHPVSPKRSSSSISSQTDLVGASPVPLLGNKTGQPNPFAQL